MSPSPDRPSVRLESDELPRGPWVYGRQVLPAPGVPDGSLVEVLDASERFVGHALYNGSSDIRLRFLSRGRRKALDRPAEFLHQRLAAADHLRRKVLRLPEASDAYRIVHGEGDDLPGLVVDRLGSTLVVEHHARGFFQLREPIEKALGQLYPGFPVVHRVPPSAVRAEGFPEADVPSNDDAAEVWIEEHGLHYPVQPAGGHKTGWFCDQRDNRLRMGALAQGRDVLDLCTNAGGFALQAARAGAHSVTAVDLDEVALARAARAGERNGLAVDWVHFDAFPFLRSLLDAPPSRHPDVAILDPHKMASSRATLEAGKAKYLDLNALALAIVRPGGLLATFSCSGALDLPSFLGIVFAAGRRADRGLRLLEVFEAAPDHPQRPEWPRSRYLKGALVALDR